MSNKEETKEAKGVDAAPRKKRQLKETIEAVVVALVLALLIRAFIVQAFKIPSSSMEDTLLIGDHLLVNKFSYGLQVPRPAMIEVLGIRVPFFETRLVRSWGELKRGDIIVFRYPGDRTKDFIKRVVGLPGEKVEVRNRFIYVNDEKWEESYGVFKGAPYGADTDRIDNFGPYLVPEDMVFVMGDNRDRSSDSRFWGPVPINDIRGKAFIIYWSWDRDSHWVRFARIADLIR